MAEGHGHPLVGKNCSRDKPVCHFPISCSVVTSDKFITYMGGNCIGSPSLSISHESVNPADKYSYKKGLKDACTRFVKFIR